MEASANLVDIFHFLILYELGIWKLSSENLVLITLHCTVDTTILCVIPNWSYTICSVLNSSQLSV